jgi:hypothetical protein
MKTIPLTKDRFCLVDDDDYSRLIATKWAFGGRYAQRSIRSHGKRGSILMHREILGLSSSDKVHVDHINGDKLDNRKENLRTCLPRQNQQNMTLSRRNASGFKGVYWHKRAKKWGARIKFMRQQTHLGLFETAEEAHEVYCLAADLLFCEFANYGSTGPISMTR